MSEIEHRDTTVPKSKISAWVSLHESDYKGQLVKIPFLAQRLTSYDFLGLDGDISLTDIAEIMTGYGLLTTAVTLRLTFVREPIELDCLNLRKGNVLSIDGLVYTDVNGVVYFNPVTVDSNIGFQADFPLDIGGKGELPYTNRLATIEVVPFASFTAGTNLDSYFTTAVDMVFDLYQSNKRYFDVARKYPNPHDLVRQIVQVYGNYSVTPYVSHISEEDRLLTNSGRVLEQIEETNNSLLSILGLIRPDLNAEILDVELTYPQAQYTLGSTVIPVSGSEFKIRAIVLVYTVLDTRYLVMLTSK